jgi:predicted phage-related endonuclease
MTMAYKQTKTIGGTAVSAIVGCNPYAGPWDAWQRILFKTTVPENEAMARGTRLEGPIADVLGPRIGMTLVEPLEGTIIIDDTFSATADRLGYVDGKLQALIEIKTAGTYGKLNPLPEHYRLQVQHYLWAFGLDSGILAGLKTTNETFRMLDNADDVAFALSRGAADLIIHEIPKDPHYEEKIVPYLRRWFNDHIVNEVPPDPDGTDGCRIGLARYYSERDGEMELTKDLERWIQARDHAKQAEADAKANKQHWDNHIRATMGNFKRAVNESYIITMSRQKGRVSLDQKRLKEEMPEVWEKYQKQGEPFETLRIKQLKKEEA